MNCHISSMNNWMMMCRYRWSKGEDLWSNPVCKSLRCGHRIHYCSFHQYDVSFSKSVLTEQVLFFFLNHGLLRITIVVCFDWRAIKRSNCFHASGGKDPCHMSSNMYMIIFGITEIVFSQIPDFDQVWWLSIVAAVMSFTYSTVGLGLGVAKTAGNSENSIYRTFKCTCNMHSWNHWSQLGVGQCV